jgi:hypothetical protein
VTAATRANSNTSSVASYTRPVPRQEKRGGAHLDGLGRLKRIELQIELSRDSSQTDFVIKT